MNELLKSYLMHTGRSMDRYDVTSVSEVISDDQQQYVVTLTYSFEFNGHKHSNESTETISVSDLLVFLFERNA